MTGDICQPREWGTIAGCVTPWRKHYFARGIVNCIDVTITTEPRRYYEYLLTITTEPGWYCEYLVTITTDRGGTASTY